MNVDLSPDRKTILFDLLGDLYIVSAKGGIAVQLTRGLALNLRPIWSPDGKRIAYISDFSGARHLNVRDLKGKYHRILGKSESQLDYKQDALWLPDSQDIMINGSVYDLDGKKTVLNNSLSHPIRFTSSGKPSYYIDSGKLYYQDYLLNIKNIVATLPADAQNGNLSPNNRWWIYFKDTDDAKRCLIVRDLRNNQDRVLVPSLNGKGKPLPYVQHYSFSPDSKAIYIGYRGKIHCIDIQSGNDHIIPFVANIKSDLGALNYNTFSVSNAPFKVKYTRSASLSPNGKQLVFFALGKIYVMNLPNGKPYILSKQSEAQFQPAYSPDGKWITYVTWSDTSGGYVWRVSANGGRPERLTSIPGQYQHPTWSPDGTLLAVIKASPVLNDRDDIGSGQLQLLQISGGDVKIIADSIPLWNNINFTKNGQRIIYMPRMAENSGYPLPPQLVSRDLNGKNQYIISIGPSVTFTHQKSLSPDGRYMVYSADEDLYLIPVNKLKNPLVMSEDEEQHPTGIRFASGVDPNWQKDGKILSWCYGNKFYRINPDKIIKAADIAILSKNTHESIKQRLDVNIVPDQVIALNITVQQYYGHGTIAMKNVRILTMHGSKVIEHGTIVIKNGRFVAVGKTNDVGIPIDAQIINLKGKTIMPGLIDLHDHMRIPSNIFPQQSWMFLANLAYGVTTARDPSLSFDSFGYAELLESGSMIGPRLYSVGRAVRLTDGVMRVANIADALSIVRKRALLGGSEIKQYQLPTRIQRQWLTIACKKLGLNMTNEGGRDLILNIGMIKDGSTGLEHNPQWGDVYKDVTQFFSKSKIFFTPTLQVDYSGPAEDYFKFKYWHRNDPKLARFTYSDSTAYPRAGGIGGNSFEMITNWHSKDTSNKSFIYSANLDAQIRRRGGRVTLGSHGNDEGIGAQDELWALQMGGITNMEALQAATFMGAEALGIQKDVGSIEVGKIADLIILNKNPLLDIHNSREIKYVMKDGILYDGDSLNTIWPFKRKCPEWKLSKAIKPIK